MTGRANTVLHSNLSNRFRIEGRGTGSRKDVYEGVGETILATLITS